MINSISARLPNALILYQVRKQKPEAKLNKKWICIGIALAGLLCISVIGAGILLFIYQKHSAQSDQWGTEYSTKGMLLTLTEVSREKDQNGVAVITYAVSTAGVPQDQTYTLLGKNFSEESPVQLGEFRIDDSGKLLDTKNGQLFDHFTADQYAMGQALNMAVMNPDKSIRVYARVIPFPIEATDGKGCYLSVELLSRDGLSFMISGQGFQPNEEIVDKNRSENESMGTTITADSNGTFSIVELPAVTGKQSGTAHHDLIGKQCNLMVQYEWGAAALQIQ